MIDWKYVDEDRPPLDEPLWVWLADKDAIVKAVANIVRVYGETYDHELEIVSYADGEELDPTYWALLNEIDIPGSK